MVSGLWPSWTRDKFVFFMPSAHEFEIKRTDRAVGAFLKLCHDRDDIVLVTSSWGSDNVHAKGMVREAKAEGKVVFLPYVVSRPILMAFYQASNVVVDQFEYGAYGLSALEAMMCERSVITHIDTLKYRPYMRTPPPHLEARTENEIYASMKWAVENPDALASVAKESRRWVMDQHSLNNIRILEEAISKASEQRTYVRWQRRYMKNLWQCAVRHVDARRLISIPDDHSDYVTDIQIVKDGTASASKSPTLSD